MAEVTRYSKPNVLVTGATGAIGRAVCRELLVNSYRVFGLAKDAGARARLPYATVAVMGDIRRPESWEAWIKQVDVVIHLAIPPDESGSGLKEREDAERHARLLAAILDRLATLCRKNKKILIPTFSALLYEPDADGWVRETSALSSGKGFGVRQRIIYPVIVEQRRKGLKAIGMSPTFVYGRGGWFESNLLRPMGEGRSTMIGDGAQTMHYVAASDVAAGYRLAIERGIAGEDYLLADDHPTTMGAMARLVAKEMGAPPPTSVPEEELIPVLGAWKLQAQTYCSKVDSAKARQHLGWAPRFRSIEEGVPVLVRAFKDSRASQAA